jgi:ketosteroid isomerase-like protein
VGENGDIARRGLDTIVRLSFEEAQRLTSPDIDLWTLFDQPGQPPEFQGRDGLRQWFERLGELWVFLSVREVELEERDDGWVLMRVAARIRGRGSPNEFEPNVSAAVKVEDGLITKFGLFPNQAGALEMIDAG